MWLQRAVIRGYYNGFWHLPAAVVAIKDTMFTNKSIKQNRFSEFIATWIIVID